MKVLIVDDEEELVEALVERLGIRGIEAAGALGGEQALARLEDESFDIILIDVKMPGIGGHDLIQEIKRLNPRQRVVMLTGHGSAGHAERGLLLGAFSYLMKPVKIRDLVEIFEQAMASDGGGEAQ